MGQVLGNQLSKGTPIRVNIGPNDPEKPNSDKAEITFPGEEKVEVSSGSPGGLIDAMQDAIKEKKPLAFNA